MSSRWPQLARITWIAFTALGSVACGSATFGGEATVVYDYPAVYVDTPPAYVYEEPRVYYREHYAYLVDGSWYYPTDRGWVVFREEPHELGRYRVSYQEEPGYVYRSVPDYRRYDTPNSDYRYRAPEYGMPSSPPPSPRYRTPASPSPAPRYPAPVPPARR